MTLFKIRCSSLFFHLITPLIAMGQLNADDSLFMRERFQESLYTNPLVYPGDWYVDSAVNSPADLHQRVASIFKFSASEWGTAFNSLKINDKIHNDYIRNTTFNYYYNTFGNAYQQYDPLINLSFELNNKKSAAYSTFTPTLSPSGNEIGFLVIPGSNANQTTDIILGNGYHNQNCYIKNLLRAHGDVFILCKPLEDYRALQWDNMKCNSGDYLTPGKNYIYNYLDSINRPYGVNYMIEALALIKYMKTHYRKVVVLGCSQGGYAALLCSLVSSPDATIVSSGYSRHIDSDTNFQTELKQNFGSLPLGYPAHLIKNLIASSATDFLFTWGNNDSYWYQQEHDFRITQSYFDNSKNCSYFYNYENHAFPTCFNLDTFILKTLDKPKLSFLPAESASGALTTATIEFCGDGPFSFKVFRNGNEFKRYDIVSSDLQLNINYPGQYEIRFISNLRGQTGICDDTLNVYPLALESNLNPADSFKLITFANPVRSNLIIKPKAGSPFRLENSRLTITSPTGQRMLSERLNHDGIEIETAHWSQGIYLMTLNSGSAAYHYKIYKQD